MTAPQLTLFVYPESPFCEAIEIALRECKIEFTRYVLDPQKPKTKALLRRSPFGRIPVLVEQLHAGEFSVSETPAILLYLAERFKHTELAISDATLKSEIFAWMCFIDSSWGERVLRLFHQPSLTETDEELVLLERELKILDNYLSCRAFLVGSYSIADVFALPFLELLKQMPNISMEWFPHLQSWHQRLRLRRGYQSILKQRALG